MTEGKQVRANILQALEAELVGWLYAGDHGEQEVLRPPPSRWYLTGSDGALGA